MTGVPKQEPASFEVLHEHRVRMLEELPADQRHVWGERSVRPDRVDDGQPVPATHPQVVGPERRRLVNEPGAVLSGHVLVDNDVMGFRDVHQPERRRVLPAFHLGAGEPARDSPVRTQGRRE